MENYEINEDTLAIIGDNYGNTRIIEKNQEYVIQKKAYEVMDENCKYYGSSYNGRLKAAKEILDCSYKLPIIMEESSMLIFFPTKSSLLDDCCWINYNAIRENENSGSKTLLKLINNQELLLDISLLSLKNQIYRATRLESIIRQRLKSIRRE
jgi:Genetic competence transcription factor